MTAYMIARIEVTDPDEYMKYAKQTVALAVKYGGKFLAKGGPFKQLEGEGPDRHVVIEFADMETAETWYSSEAYQKILPIALASSRRDLVLVQGA